MTLQTQRVRTLEQVRVFIEGSEAVDFVGGDREGVYVLVRRTLVQLEYHHRLSKPDKGLVKRYLEKVTGLSRSQLTRLIGQHLRTGKIKDRRGKVPARPFERRYMQSDIRLLAKVDELLNQMSGLGTRAVLRREFAVYGNARFERLAGLSNGHLYNLRQSRTYRTNDNALAESKNASVVRKWLGYAHIPQRFAGQVNAFNRDWLSPFLNYHRPCLFPTEECDDKGRVRKRYRDADTMTPYDKFKSLDDVEQYLLPGVTFEQLDNAALAVSDVQAAEALNQAREELFRSLKQADTAA